MLSRKTRVSCFIKQLHRSSCAADGNFCFLGVRADLKNIIIIFRDAIDIPLCLGYRSVTLQNDREKPPVEEKNEPMYFCCKTYMRPSLYLTFLSLVPFHLLKPDPLILDDCGRKSSAENSCSIYADESCFRQIKPFSVWQFRAFFTPRSIAVYR